MAFGILPTAFGALLTLGLYKFIIYPALLSPLARIPNAHWSCSISPLWILWTRFRLHENRKVHSAHLECGPVIRLGPNEISINNVDGGIRTVYTGGFEKGDWYSIFDNYGVPCMFSALNSRSHSSRKRMTSNIYSKSNIQSSLALAAQGSTIIFDRLLPIITASTDDSQIPKGIDVYDLWNATTMDSITAFQFGLSNATNFLENIGYRRHWLELYQSRKTYTFFPQELPRLTAFMRTIGIRLVPRWVDYANREIEAWCADMCRVATANAGPKESYQNLADEPVVLNSLIAGIKKERKSKGAESVLAETTLAQTELSISSEMLDNLAAGHETSGITLTYLTWHLSQDLTLQEKLRAELLTLDHPMQYPPNSEKIQLPNSKELDNLPLLHAVIMETLRLDAAIPGSQPRMSPFPSSVLGGYEIPGGVRVSAAAYSLHRNMTVFPHADAWDHTRWLDSAETNEPDEDRTKDRDRYFWAFSSGGRMCVGSNFAMHAIKLVVAAVYTNFTTHVVNDDGIEQMDGYTCGPTSNKLLLRFEKVVG